MGNMQCPAEDAAHLASIARDICPFPNYTPSPLFVNMLSANYSLQLRDHYTAVQSSLTPKQLEDFTRGLRTTFGREGKVTLGGVGVVALSLAVLFDTLARQVRGQWVSDSGPIPGLFLKHVSGYYPPQVYTVSEYLRLVPHIANNPTRMREESERYHKQLINEDQSWDKSILGENRTLPTHDAITAVNVRMGHFFAGCLKIHLFRIKNAMSDKYWSSDRTYSDMIFNVNCDPEAADQEFLAKMQKSVSSTRDAFKRCKRKSGHIPKTWLPYVAQLELADVMFLPYHAAGYRSVDSIIAEREDFDLKTDAHANWVQ